MSLYNNPQRAVALKYSEENRAPIIVASGLGHIAEKMVEIAEENDVPVYEDTSLTTVLSQLDLGTPVPEELYKAIVDIYVYFLNYLPSDTPKASDTTETPKKSPEAPPPQPSSTPDSTT